MQTQFQRVIKRIHYSVSLLPLSAPVVLVAFAVPIVVLLLFDNLDSGLVLAIGTPLAVVAVHHVSKYYKETNRPGSKKEQLISDWLVLIGVILWLLISGSFTSQHIFTNRDPATYTNGAVWLVDHESIHIDRPENIFKGNRDVTINSGGFYKDSINKDKMFAQGAHLLPAFLGLGGRALSVGAMLHLNVIFGATAILALYGVGRSLLKPRWALLAAAAVAGSLPLLYFSRDTYSEPLTATFVFGALGVMYIAMKGNQGRLPLWFLAGGLVGATTMTRIDGFLVVTPIVAFMAIYVAFSKIERRGVRLKQSGSFAVGLAITTLLGWLDLMLLSTQYYNNLSDKFRLMLLALLIVSVLGTILVVLSLRTGFIDWITRKSESWRVPVFVVGAAIVVALLASQPFWRRSYSSDVSGFVVSLAESVGADPAIIVNEKGIEASRNFAEQAVLWAGWYIGPLFAIFGAAGIIYIISKIISKNYQQEYLFWLPAVLVIGGSCLVYFIKPSIAPDQIWASRRLLPVILPGLALFGVAALSRASTLSPKYFFGASSQVVVAVIATLAVLSPLIVSAPFITLRERPDRLVAMESFCSALPDNAAVIWVGIGGMTAIQPTHAFCKVPVTGMLKKRGPEAVPSKQQLIRLYKSALKENKQALIAVYGNNNLNLIDGELTTVYSSVTQEVESTLLRPPHRRLDNTLALHLGVIQPNGGIVPMDSLVLVAP